MSPILIHFKVAQLRPEKVAQYHRKRWHSITGKDGTIATGGAS
jgi:hypothetical protein